MGIERGPRVTCRMRFQGISGYPLERTRYINHSDLRVGLCN